ncbi:hypothetical protein GCM10009839_03360 [Catenulispora yoronensis]|uniref:DUF4245 domain-containing protein n=1 Tax=Catenulispora yoronensis TaxID=450799 RepID=A0ABP5EZX9_9ACTN
MARVSPLKKTVRDMVLSMAVISLPIVAIVEWFPHDSKKPEDAAQTVDYSIPLDQARRDPDLPFTALAPASLPAGWRATSVHADLVPGEPQRWELGFLTPDKQYVALDQITGAHGVESVLGDQAPDATPLTGSAAKVTSGGFDWQVYVSGDGKRHALVRTTAPTGTAAAAAGPVGVVVSGTVGVTELAGFAGSLK